MRIASYTQAFGIPLMETREPATAASVLLAVSSGIDRPFQIQPVEEVEGRGPRLFHYVWSQQKIERGEIPDGYLRAFEGSDADDLRCYLKEVLNRWDECMRVYAQVYSEVQILSMEMIRRWLGDEIDFAATDIETEELGPALRALSSTYRRALEEIPDMDIEWTHPVTRESLGSIRRSYASSGGPEALIATTPAALSCLQALLAQRGSPIRIETRYIDG